MESQIMQPLTKGGLPHGPGDDRIVVDVCIWVAGVKVCLGDVYKEMKSIGGDVVICEEWIKKVQDHLEETNGRVSEAIVVVRHNEDKLTQIELQIVKLETQMNKKMEETLYQTRKYSATCLHKDEFPKRSNELERELKSLKNGLDGVQKVHYQTASEHSVKLGGISAAVSLLFKSLNSLSGVVGSVNQAVRDLLPRVHKGVKDCKEHHHTMLEDLDTNVKDIQANLEKFQSGHQKDIPLIPLVPSLPQLSTTVDELAKNLPRTCQEPEDSGGNNG